MKFKRLYRIALACGYIPLIGGLFIFFTWYIARICYAINLESFELYGFFWLVGSFWVAILGLILMVIFIVQNGRKYIKHFLIGVALILINIPTVNWVLDEQYNASRGVYIRIKNNSLHRVDLTLRGYGYMNKVGTLEDGESTIAHFDPHYWNEYEVEPARLMITLDGETKIDTLPTLYDGWCARFYLDKEFKLVEK